MQAHRYLKKAAAPTKAEIKFAEKIGATQKLINASQTPRKKGSREKYNSGKLKHIIQVRESVDTSESETNNQKIDGSFENRGGDLS